MTSLASATNGVTSSQNAYSEALRTAQLESERLTNASNNVTAARNREQNAALATLEAEDRLTRARKAGTADAEKMLILEEKVEAAKRNEENATIAVEQAITAEKVAVKAAAAEKERLTSAVNNHRLALLREGDAQRSVSATIRDHNEEMRRASNVIDTVGDSLSGLGTRAFKVTRGLGTIAIPAVVQFLVQTAQVAVTASQSIALLPAVAAAAGAGMGTLQLATQGFSDSLKDIRDVDKFAEDIGKLAPNAQQTALALQSMLPLFDRVQQAAQNAFFAGGSGMALDLGKTFAPDIETLTTSIANSMNQAMKGVSATLLSTGGQSQVSGIFDNIAQSFQNAAPAAQSFTQALLDITEVGSGFLPGLAQDISDVAAEFADFIREARDDGSLQKWIQEGIDAMKMLGSAVWSIGEFLYDTFGDASREDLDRWKGSLDTILNILELIGDAVKVITAALDPFAAKTKFLSYLFGDGPGSDNDLGAQAREQLNKKLKQLGLDQVPGPDGLPTDTGGANIFGLPLSAGKGGVGSGVINPKEAFRSPFGGGIWDTKKNKTPKGGKLSDKEKLDQIAAGLDPNSYKVDPYAPVGGLPSGPMPGGGYGPGAQNAQDILEAQHGVESQAHDLEESKRDRLALEKSGTATQKEIDDAKWKELEDGWALQKAQANLVEKQRGTTKNLTDGMNDLGVALDPDLGLSKGLSGFAENMTRMLGNMLTAPLEKQLQATINADPIKGGFGLLGILGAQNMANGLSPLLGQPYPGGSSGASSAYGGPLPGASSGGGYGLPGGTNTGGYGSGGKGVFPDWVQQVGSAFGVTPSTYSGHQETDRNEAGYAPNPGHENRGIDWTGTPEAMQKFADYLKNVPGMEQVIWNGAGQGTGDTVEIAGGRSQPGYFAGDLAGHGNHVHTRQSSPIPLPGGGFAPGTDTAAMPGTASSSAAFGGGGATPVFVTNMPGGGGFPFGSPASGQGSGPAPGPAGGASAGMPNTGANWDALAAKESSGNWGINTGNGYYGGLQFDDSTWKQYGGDKFAPRADLATKEQQIQIAEAAKAARGDGGASLWPQNYGQLGAPGDLFTTGGGQGPIFRKPQGGGASASGTGYGNLNEGTSYVPPGAEYGPSQFLGLDPTQPFGPLSQAPGGGFTPMGPTPGGIGPFPTPGALTGLGGVGNSSGLRPGGTGGSAGWTPQGGTPAADPTRIGGVNAGGTPNMGGTGGIGVSDGLMALASTAASGLDLIAPGAGQAAQIGMKLANRAVQYGSQLAGIGVSGLMETFLPTGGSELANSGWIPRIVGGIAGAKPALPNVAGGKAGNGTNGDPGQGAPPLSPDQASAHGGGGAPGPGNQITNNIDYSVQNQTEDAGGKDLTHHLTKGYGG